MALDYWGGTKMLMNNNEYLNTIESIKPEMKSAQYKAAVSVNRELISEDDSYWVNRRMAHFFEHEKNMRN